jgi:NAD(P)-dependent dehydrogenase (short-subunit alcohol dehydrogenase family)
MPLRLCVFALILLLEVGMSTGLFDLTGKVGLVTGGNSGIGLGFAEGLAMCGAAVAIWGRKQDKLDRAQAQLSSHGGRVLALRCDVADPDQVEEAFARTVAELGGVDACFANAGVHGSATPFVETPLEEWRRVGGINLEGAVTTLQAAVRHMLERGQGGSLVATSSTSVVFGAPRSEQYAATKGALLALMRGIAVEHARHGIRANAVMPGWIDTPMTEGFLHSEAFESKVLRRVPQRRWGVGADFRGIAAYLASDASAYHTGDVFTIDGGYSRF